MSEFKKLAVASAGLVTTAVIAIMGIAVLQGIEDTGKISNTTADAWIAGITTMAGFVGILMLAIIGKAVMKIFKSD
jgi:hypothetical protein